MSPAHLSGVCAARMIAILGGSFDPVHFGHLRLALEVRQELAPREVRLVPSGRPPHRAAPIANGEQRVALLRVATAGVSGLFVDDRELHRAGPSYTVATLEAMRAEFGDIPLALIVGMDAFLGLPTWHTWERVPELAHIIVAHRPGSTPPWEGPLAELMAARATREPQELHHEPAGKITLFPATQLEISSSRIRALIGDGKSARYLLPDAVLELIESYRLYH